MYVNQESFLAYGLLQHSSYFHIGILVLLIAFYNHDKICKKYVISKKHFENLLYIIANHITGIFLYFSNNFVINAK